MSLRKLARCPPSRPGLDPGESWSGELGEDLTPRSAVRGKRPGRIEEPSISQFLLLKMPVPTGTASASLPECGGGG